MAGCGANSTAEAIELAKFAKEVGADCQLQVVPYYNKPTQEGQYQHFKAIAEAVGDLPIVLYNVPGRTVADMAHDTVLRLAQVPGIVGIKEATGNIERAQWLIREVPKGFAVYSGDDPTAVALMLCGGQGNISVTANVAPRLMHELCVAAMAGDVHAAMEHPVPADAAAQQPVRRSQPDSGEMGHGPHGPVRRHAAPAADALDAPATCRGRRRPARQRPDLTLKAVQPREDIRRGSSSAPALIQTTRQAAAAVAALVAAWACWPAAPRSGCSMLEGDKIDYKSAAQGATLDVPPDLTQLSRDIALRRAGRAPSPPAATRPPSRTQPRVPTAVAMRGRRAHRARRQPALAGGQPPGRQALGARCATSGRKTASC